MKPTLNWIEERARQGLAPATRDELAAYADGYADASVAPRSAIVPIERVRTALRVALGESHEMTFPEVREVLAAMDDTNDKEKR